MPIVGDYQSDYSGEQVDRVVEKGLAAIKTVTIAGTPSERITVPYGAITGTLANQEDLQDALDDKQDTLTAGSNIQIANNVISATDTTYTAGTNVQIANNIISATDTIYTAGTGINIVNNVISATASAPQWGDITGTLSSQTDLNDVLVDIQNNKQGTIQYSVMPTATQSMAGKIVEYTGTTTTDYIHGYIYEAKYDSESLTVTQTAGTSVGIITTDLSTFKSAIGANLASGTYLFNYASGSWTLGSDSTAIDISDYGITFSGTATDGATISAVYADASAYWQRIDVQPSASIATLTNGVSQTMVSNYIYSGSSMTSIILEFPASIDATFASQVNITTGASASFSISSGTIMKGDDCSSSYVFSPQANASYSLLFSYINATKVGIAIKIS